LEWRWGAGIPYLPVTKGLTGSAIQQKCTIVVGNVKKDPRYLTTLGGTISEIIIPILGSPEPKVIGTIDIESELENAFSQQDRQVLERCAHAARPLVRAVTTSAAPWQGKTPGFQHRQIFSLCWSHSPVNAIARSDKFI
jgi:hypothetical protein